MGRMGEILKTLGIEETSKINVSQINDPVSRLSQSFEKHRFMSYLQIRNTVLGSESIEKRAFV